MAIARIYLLHPFSTLLSKVMPFIYPLVLGLLIPPTATYLTLHAYNRRLLQQSLLLQESTIIANSAVPPLEPNTTHPASFSSSPIPPPGSTAADRAVATYEESLHRYHHGYSAPTGPQNGIRRVVKPGMGERLKERWNWEVESLVRRMQRIEWRTVREAMERRWEEWREGGRKF